MPFALRHFVLDNNVASHPHCRANKLCLEAGVLESNSIMVNVLKGVLVECDPAMKQFLLYLDETSALGKKFIIQDLDDTHVFILAEVVHILQERVGELMDQNSFPITQK
uniref:General transcription and DNA repair factor IIH subunit TFB5 n=1 Tax=Hucho hucho TaxID=62062 RepID=A0A4W5KQI6_9TELE